MNTGKPWKNLVSAFLIVSMLAPSVLLVPWHEAEAQNSVWYFEFKPTFVEGVSGKRRVGPFPNEVECVNELNATLNANEGTITDFCREEQSVTPSTVTGANTGGQPKDPRAEAAKGAGRSCSNLIGGAVKSLFGKGAKQAASSAGKESTSKAAGAVSKKAGDSVPTFDENTYNLIYEVNVKTDSIQTDTSSINKKQNCWDGIAKVLMKIAIRRITLSIIDWINSGYDGKPFFLENPEGFFKDIAKNEILTFGASINNVALFPFGRNFMIGAINAFRNKFEVNAQYSLNELIAKTNPGRTGADFNANFNIGGWDAWLGMTYPQNNPIGFNILAANELSVRLDGTQQSKANETKQYLQQTGGFLGDERCVDPHNVSHEDDRKARAGDKNYSKCNRWEYVTPGKLIAERAVYAANSPLKNLEMADEINSALAAISDAALNQFITNLSNKGLKSITGVGNTETFNISANANFSPAGTGTQFPDFFVAPGSWISNHLDFDMRTDVTQAFIDEQRTYSSKLSEYSTAIAELILWIRQLDYCIPGPNPNWEQTTSELVSGIGSIQTAGKNGWEVASEILSFSSLASAFGNVGSWIALGGTLTGIGASWIGSKREEKENHQAAAIAVEKLLDVYIYHGQDQMWNQAGVDALMNNVFNEYSRVIRNVYFSGEKTYLPAVTSEARSLFTNITGHQKTIQNNHEEILFRKSIITRLGGLKEKIDDLNNKLELGQISGADYEKQFQPTSPFVTEFARLSAYFVDGDDIANVDNLAEETRTEKEYVKNDLLAGPFGCEEEMRTLWKNKPSVYSAYTRRQPYPFPIDHLYGSITNTGFNGPWDDPWTQSKYNAYNKNPNEGFLWGAAYSNSHANYSGAKNQCPNEWIGYIPLSLPTNNKDGDPVDIGGLEFNGDGNGAYKNDCGVVTRGFEKTFMVY